MIETKHSGVAPIFFALGHPWASNVFASSTGMEIVNAGDAPVSLIASRFSAQLGW